MAVACTVSALAFVVAGCGTRVDVAGTRPIAATETTTASTGPTSTSSTTTTSTPPPTTTTAPPTTTTTDPTAALWGHTYTAVSVRTDGRPRPLAEGTEIVATFERSPDGDSLRWNGGCNTAGGRVDLAGGRVHLDEVGSTAVKCFDEARNRQDEWVTAFMTSVPAWALDGTRLTLAGSRTTFLLERTG